ncbi:unnamed protein product [Cochlearia groenlandica]
MGQLPGKPEANPKEYVNALHLRSGRQLPSGYRIEDNADQFGEVEQSLNTETTVLDDENTAGGDEENSVHSYRPGISATAGRYRPPIPAKNKADTEKKDSENSHRSGVSATAGRYRPPVSAKDKADTLEKET